MKYGKKGGWKKRKGGFHSQSQAGYVKKWKRDMRSGAHRVSICYTPSVVPDIMRVCLQYNSFGNTFEESKSGIDKVFRGNSLFDPDFTGTGQQPLGHDQWSSFYRKYRVLASKIVFTATSGTDQSGVILFVVPLNTNIALGNRQQVDELPYKKTKFLGESRGTNVATITHYMDTCSIRGVPKAAVRIDGELAALISADPEFQWYWHIGVINLSNTGTVVSEYNVCIHYYVEYFDRATLGRS